MALSDTDRTKLDGIVQQMTQNKESDSYIQSVVDDFKGKYDKGTTMAKSPSSPTLTGDDNPVGSLPVLKQLTQFGTGLGTGIAKVGLSLGQGASKIVGGISKGLDSAGNFLFGKAPTSKYNDASNYYGAQIPGQLENIKQKVYTDPFKTELDTGLGKTGEVTAAVAPYLATGGVVSGLTNKAATLAGTATETLFGGTVAPALARIFAGATAEAAQNYVLGYALSGGDTKEAKTQALVAGSLKGFTSGVGEILKGMKVDKGLMSTIYKTDKADVRSGLFGGAEKTSLAQEALDRGIGGNAKQQAVQIQQGLSNAENALSREFEAAGNPPIKLDNPQRFIDAIQNRISLLEKGGATTEAQGLKSSLPAISPDGTIPANNALGLRRFLDSLRREKSFVSQTEQLGAEQAGLKEMTDSLRRQINSIGENSSIMKDYQFFLDAKDKLINYAYKSGNKASTDFLNKLLLAESLFAHSPVGLGLVLGRGAIKGAPVSTAQFVKNLPMSSPLGSATRSIIGSAVGSATTPSTLNTR